MLRQNIIALVGSVLFVAIAFWVVASFFPGAPATPSDPIIGKWGLAKRSGCSDAEGYMTVTADAVAFYGKGLSTSPIVIKAFETDANGTRLRGYLKGGLENVDILMPYKIEGDALTFGPSNWAPESRAKFPNEIAQMDAGPWSPGKTIYKALQMYQPYHRCEE